MAVVPKGALERRSPGYSNYPAAGQWHTVEARDDVILRVTEFRIGLDYLEHRPEIDMGRIAHVGFSWGALSRAIILDAIEPRIRSIVYIGGGLKYAARGLLPEANALNFASRITSPTLLLTGKYDEIVPFDPYGRQLFELLPGSKRLELVDSGHLPPSVIRNPIINAWLDETLGPVAF